MPNELEEIQKRHLDDSPHIAGFFANSVHMDWIEQINRDRAWLLDHVQNLEQQL